MNLVKTKIKKKYVWKWRKYTLLWVYVSLLSQLVELINCGFHQLVRGRKHTSVIGCTSSSKQGIEGTRGIYQTMQHGRSIKCAMTYSPTMHFCFCLNQIHLTTRFYLPAEQERVICIQEGIFFSQENYWYFPSSVPTQKTTCA